MESTFTFVDTTSVTSGGPVFSLVAETSTDNLIEFLRVEKGSSIFIENGGRIEGPIVIRGDKDHPITIDFEGK